MNECVCASAPLGCLVTLVKTLPIDAEIKRPVYIDLEESRIKMCQHFSKSFNYSFSVQIFVCYRILYILCVNKITLKFGYRHVKD